MATEQVLSWIQNDLKLSQVSCNSAHQLKVVSNFETDFSSGYLLGEVLSHYGLTDSSQFTKKYARFVLTVTAGKIRSPK
jgi:hypothetical protein